MSDPVSTDVQSARQQVFDSAYRYYRDGGLPANNGVGGACYFQHPITGGHCAIGAAIIGLGGSFANIPVAQDPIIDRRTLFQICELHGSDARESVRVLRLADHRSNFDDIGFLESLQNAHDYAKPHATDIVGPQDIVDALIPLANWWDLSIPSD